jgi:hypothetical protein
MEMGPSHGANSCSATQKVPKILYNPMYHYRFHKRLQFFPFLSQINPVYDLSSYFCDIHFDISHWG